MAAEYLFDPKFVGSTLKLEPREAQRVWAAVEQYTSDPSTPSLQLERLQGRAGKHRLCSIRASGELRVLLSREGSVTVFLRAGHHDAIYELADRTAFVAPAHGAGSLIAVRPGTVDLDGSPMVTPVAGSDSKEAAPSGPSILEHWSTPELQAAGFDDEEIELLRRSTADSLLDVWADIDEETLSLVLELAELTPKEWADRRLIEDAELEAERFRAAVVERGALAGLSSVLSAEEVARLAAAPIEDWMIFLHPDQRALVDRRFNGPARVRGSAGTGKTVVALHRAAALAKRIADVPLADRKPVLFTTFVNNLPPVFENLYRRLPTAVPGVVEFINVDKLAYRICRDAGETPRLEPRVVNAAFTKAFDDVVRPGTPLHRAGLTRGYLRDEVTAVMKGRGVDSLDEYLNMERTGRRTPFNEAMRRQAWELRENWDRRLADKGVVDFPDVVRRARDLARRRAEPMFSHAIIDESQDLTLVGLQMIRALVNGPDGRDRPDGLFIVGDGAQKIYAGGFTLGQAGVDVRGNSTVLRVNYRNTRQIIETAMACTGREAVNDLGDEYARADAEAEARRDGAPPVLVTATDFDAEIDFVVEQVRRLGETGVVGPGDVGICVPTNKLVKKTMARLDRAGLACQELAKFDGRTNDFVKVGTFHRAKGLEFKVVFLLGLSADTFPSPQQPGQSDAEYADQRALQVSQLFVAMTRARDGLFVLCDGEPSDVVRDALPRFELMEA